MKPQLRTELKLKQRLAILGRMRMADWIEMPEKEFAGEIAKIEKDPLFKKLFFGNESLPGAIRRQRWPAGRLSGSFYEVNEATVAGGERVQVEKLLQDRVALIEKIRKIGQKEFEKYFIQADEPVTLQEIARRLKITDKEVHEIHALVLELGAKAEFELPERDPALKRGYSCIARVSVDDEKPSFEFLSAHWARGLYQVRYDVVQDWKTKGLLGGEERRHLPHLLKRIETVNLRQNTLYRIMETLTALQTRFLEDRHEDSKRPISLRQLARRLDLAPSTVSRALSGRSVALPWGKEVPLITLVPGRRNVVREILAQWLEKGADVTDAALAERLRKEKAIRISRRTVNAVRNEVQKSLPK